MRSTAVPSLESFDPQGWYLRRAKLLERKIVRKRRALHRSIISRRKKTHRFALTKQQTAIRWWHRQYQFNDAAYDVKRAYLRNEDIMLGLLILGYFLAYVVVSNGADILYFFSQAILTAATVFSLAIVPFLLLMLGGLALCLFWLFVVIVSAVQGSVMESLVRKRYKSLRIALKRSARGSGRMIVAFLLVAAIVGVPLGVATLLLLSSMMFGYITPEQVMQYGQYGVIVALLWPVYCAMHYALVPVIAHFQPQASWQSVITQSHELVRKKGRVFLLLMHCALVLGFAAVYATAWMINVVLPVGVIAVTVFGCFALMLLYQAVLTLIYYRRRRSW